MFASTYIYDLLNNQVVQIIISAFYGGLFAGLWANHFESKRRIEDKRRDKYFEHRNTIVQIEHELIPLRVNLSRNLASIDDAIANTQPDSNIRLILRFYKLKLSTGLSLQLLNLELINEYAQLYSLVESINSDFEYISGIIDSIKESIVSDKVNRSMLNTYTQVLTPLLNACKEADEKSLNLLAITQVALKVDKNNSLKEYLKTGNQVSLEIDDSKLKAKREIILKEETRPPLEGEKPPKFIALYLDVKKVLIHR